MKTNIEIVSYTEGVENIMLDGIKIGTIKRNEHGEHVFYPADSNAWYGTAALRQLGKHLTELNA